MSTDAAPFRRGSAQRFTGAGDPSFDVIGVSTPVAGCAPARGVSPGGRFVVVSTAAAGTAIVSGPFRLLRLHPVATRASARRMNPVRRIAPSAIPLRHRGRNSRSDCALFVRPRRDLPAVPRRRSLGISDVPAIALERHTRAIVTSSQNTVRWIATGPREFPNSHRHLEIISDEPLLNPARSKGHLSIGNILDSQRAGLRRDACPHYRGPRTRVPKTDHMHQLVRHDTAARATRSPHRLDLRSAPASLDGRVAFRGHSRDRSRSARNGSNQWHPVSLASPREMLTGSETAHCSTRRLAVEHRSSSRNARNAPLRATVSPRHVAESLPACRDTFRRRQSTPSAPSRETRGPRRSRAPTG